MATTPRWVGWARARDGGLDLTGYNLGVRRETSLDVERRFLPELTPRLRNAAGPGVVLAVGINDTTVEGSGRRVEETATLDALQRMAEQAAARGWPLLVVGPGLVADEEQNRRIAELSRAMHIRCEETGIPFVDVAGRLANDTSWRDEVAGVDGAHPSSAGYRRLSEIIWPSFAGWLDSLAGGGRAYRLPMRVIGLDHVVVICSDVENTLAWWQRELGLEPLRLEEFRAGGAPFPSLRLNAATIVDFIAGERTGENIAHVALEVDATAAELEALVEQRGWDVAVPLDRALFGARGIGAGIYIRDPEGNVLELRSYAG